MIVAVVFGGKPLAGGEFAGKSLAGISLGYTKIWTAPVLSQRFDFKTPGTYPITLPGWFRPGVDFVDRIVIGAGAGGYYSYNTGSVGGSSSAAFGTNVLTSPGGKQQASSTVNGADSLPITYNDVTYPGAPGGLGFADNFHLGGAGGVPGAGGGASTSYAAYRGGGSAAYVADTIQPTDVIGSVTVGAGGPGGTQNHAGQAGGPGGDGWVVIWARQSK